MTLLRKNIAREFLYQITRFYSAIIIKSGDIAVGINIHTKRTRIEYLEIDLCMYENLIYERGGLEDHWGK